MIDPLRFTTETAAPIAIQRAVLCGVCLTKGGKNQADIASKFCIHCERHRFLCSSCDVDIHRIGIAQRHSRRLVVLGPSAHKQIIVRGDAKTFPQSLDTVRITYSAQVVHDNELLRYDSHQTMEFLVGSSGPCVHFQILGALNLGVLGIESLNPFVVLTYCGHEIARTRCKYDEFNPTWTDCTAVIPINLHSPPRSALESQKEHIRILLCDADGFWGHKVMGEIDISKSRILTLASNTENKSIKIPIKSKKTSCYVGLRAMKVDNSVFIHISCIEGTFPSNSSSKQPYFCKMFLKEKLLQQTDLFEEKASNRCSDSFIFSFLLDELDHILNDESVCFRVEVFVSDIGFCRKELKTLGSVNITIRDLKTMILLPVILPKSEAAKDTDLESERKPSKVSEDVISQSSFSDDVSSVGAHLLSQNTTPSHSSSRLKSPQNSGRFSLRKMNSKSSKSFRASFRDPSISALSYRSGSPFVESVDIQASTPKSILSTRLSSSPKASVRFADGKPRFFGESPDPQESVKLLDDNPDDLEDDRIDEVDEEADAELLPIAPLTQDELSSLETRRIGYLDSAALDSKRGKSGVSTAYDVLSIQKSNSKDLIEEESDKSWSSTKFFAVSEKTRTLSSLGENQCFLVCRILNSNRGEVILGLDEAVRCMSLGETSRVFVRFDYAYGSFMVLPKVAPRSNFIFLVQLQQINGQGMWQLPLRIYLRLRRFTKRMQKRIYHLRLYVNAFRPLAFATQILHALNIFSLPKAETVSVSDEEMQQEAYLSRVDSNTESIREDLHMHHNMFPSEDDIEAKLSPKKFVSNDSATTAANFLWSFRPKSKTIISSRLRSTKATSRAGAKYYDSDDSDDSQVHISSSPRSRSESHKHESSCDSLQSKSPGSVGTSIPTPKSSHMSMQESTLPTPRASKSPVVRRRTPPAIVSSSSPRPARAKPKLFINTNLPVNK